MRSTESMSRALVRVAAIGIAVVLVVPSLARAQDTTSASAVVAPAQAIRTVATDRVAEQLGARLANAQPTELSIGASATGILSDPARLAALGLRDAKAGARVTIMRSARDRIRVEVDEFDPVARTRRMTLNLDADGRLSVVSQ